ncbi:MAG: hypothetical protein AUJ75_02280 [Candidatus Omnitrophica bacterium CG1_02_49_10]|nr:MAG: hypothetical protein AUJ75_02280 [Candidatus Omnitrophica bacterium CG1_02_49_10]
MYDLIIVGAGPAGITAGVYAARKKINTVILSKDIGGQAALSGDIDNYTGYQFITGVELAQKFEEHLTKFDIKLNYPEGVNGLEREGDLIKVNTEKGSYTARAAIVASGRRTRGLNIPGEKEFKNRGLTYCATCDAPFFGDKSVAVIGGGNAALDAALQLVRIAKKIYIVALKPALEGDEIMLEEVRSNPKVEVITGADTKEIFGEKMVKGLKYEREGKAERLDVEGVFIEIGSVPNSDFVKDVKLNDAGEIIVDKFNRTNIPGVFAAGDVTDVPEKQIIVAAGEGSKALLGVSKYLLTGK